MGRTKSKKMYSCPECRKRFTRTNHLKRHAVLHMPSRKRDVPQRMTEITRERCDLLQLRVQIKPLKMEFNGPEKDKQMQQQEELEVKTDQLSDAEQERRQNVGAYNLRGSSKQTPAKTETAAAKKSPSKELRQKRSPAHSNEKSMLTTTKLSLQGKSPLHSGKESTLTNKEKSQQTKSLLRCNDESRKTAGAVLEGKAFACSDCGLQFKEYAQLENHLRWHERMIMNSISYVCNKCGVQYKQLSRLKNHVVAVHFVTEMTQHSGKSGKRDGRGGSSRQGNDGSGPPNEEEKGKKRNEEKGHLREESEERVDECSDEENGRTCEEECKQRNEEKESEDEVDEESNKQHEEVRDLMCWEDGTTVITLVNSRQHTDEEEHCQRLEADDDQDESQLPSIQITVNSCKVQTDPLVTEERCELHSDLKQMRRSSRLSSSTYVHQILHHKASQLRRDGTNGQEDRQANAQDGRRKRQYEGRDTEMEVKRRLRQSYLVSGQPKDERNNVKIGQNGREIKRSDVGEVDEQTANTINDGKNGTAVHGHKVATGDNVRETSAEGNHHQDDQQNATGKNEQTADARSSQRNEQSGEDCESGELDARPLPSNADSAVRSYRRTVNNFTYTHRETVYTCSECGVELKGPTRLANHKRKHWQEKNGQKRQRKCIVCGHPCESLGQVRKHLLAEHGLVIPAAGGRDGKGQKMPSRLEETLYACDICGLNLTRPSHLLKHRLIHKNNQSADRILTESYKCEVCGLEYRTQHTMRRHMLFHEAEGNGKSIPSTNGVWHGKLERDEECNKAGTRQNCTGNDEPRAECDVHDLRWNSKNGQNHTQSGRKAETETVQSNRRNCQQNEEQNNQMKWSQEQDGQHTKSEQTDEENDGEIGLITPSVDELVNEITRREATLAVCATRVKLEDLVAKMYTCDICGLQRNSPLQLERHMKTHKTCQKGTYLCDQCGASYKYIGFLERHKLTHVVENSRVQSAEDPHATKDDLVSGIPVSEIVSLSENTQETTSVEQSSDDKAAADKVLIQYNTYYVCDECSTKFEHAKELLQHKLAHRREKIPGKFVCEECGLRCFRQYQLDQHMRTAHLDLRPHLCNICGKGLRCKENLLQHIRTHTGEKPFTCDTCGKGFAVKGARDNHVLLHTGRRPYKCHVCPKAFITSGNLQQHMVTHTGERRYACTICDKRFTAGCVLKNHMRFHTGEKPFSCQVCFKPFRSKGNLQQHFVTHTKVKAFECEKCKKRFVAASSLKTHLRLHEGLKPYVCKVCHKSFAALGNMKMHEAGHSTERPFSCCERNCNKSFKSSGNLKGHLVLHNQPGTQHSCRVPDGDCVFVRYKSVVRNWNHVCTVCGKKFNVPNKLRQHMVVHTGEKLSLCTLCGTGFSCAGSLKTHMRIHNGVKPYSCEVCGKEFTQMGNLNKHRSLHTGEKPFKCNLCSRVFRLNSQLKAHILGHMGQAPVRKKRSALSNAFKMKKILRERKEQSEKFVETENHNLSIVEQSDYDSDESPSSDGCDDGNDESNEDQEGSDDDDGSDHEEQE